MAMQAILSIVLWCWAIHAVFVVDSRLGWAAVVCSVAFNLSEDLRDKRLK